MTHITISRALCATGLNGYSDEGAQAKQAFHREGLRFLRALAKALNFPAGSFDVRSNLGGVAVSGEVTLHSDDLYVQLAESCLRPGVSVMFRTCDSRKDYCGHQNHFVNMDQLRNKELQTRWVQQLQELVRQVQDKKAIA